MSKSCQKINEEHKKEIVKDSALDNIDLLFKFYLVNFRLLKSQSADNVFFKNFWNNLM